MRLLPHAWPCLLAQWVHLPFRRKKLMSTANPAGIATLLEAEKEASKVVSKARACKSFIWSHHLAKTEFRNWRTPRAKPAKRLRHSRRRRSWNFRNLPSKYVARLQPSFLRSKQTRTTGKLTKRRRKRSNRSRLRMTPRRRRFSTFLSIQSCAWNLLLMYVSTCRTQLVAKLTLK